MPGSGRGRDMKSVEYGYDSRIEGDVVHTRLDAALNWFRKNSLWPMPMGLACCAIELMATAASRFDISRFGMEVMRFSPRQSDVMIVSGTVTFKMALAVKRIYDQMAEPKWVIAMGACASTGGMYRSYAVLQGMPMRDTLDFANAMAALNCMALGARGGIRGIEDVRALMTRAERRSHPEFEQRTSSAFRAT